MKVWVITLQDRHIDDVTLVAESEQGWDDAIAELQDESYEWRTHRNRQTGVIMYAYTSDDGPRIEVKYCEVRP